MFHNVLMVLELLTRHRNLLKKKEKAYVISLCITLVHISEWGANDLDEYFKITLAQNAEILANLSDDDEKIVEVLVSSKKVIPFMMSYMDWNSPFMYKNMQINHHMHKLLSFVGNISAFENAAIINQLIDQGIMYKLGMYLCSDSEKMSDRALWIYSNIVVSKNQ